MFSIIACIGKNRELGNQGGLVFQIKEDMQFFKETTMGHPVIMGDRTFTSLPHALPGRTNYVLTRHPERLPEGVIAVNDIEAFIKEHTNEEVFVIGGGFVYNEFLPYADNLYLTEVDAEAEADTFFPEFDKSKYEKTIIKKGQSDDLTYAFAKYTKLN
ncbi:MAG: dihydrofolate reductase [Candidatus Saccharibacteria bacterium]|nr:dihydrofolate reductase [Candidatus Saccharibacteria bacterium]